MKKPQQKPRWPPYHMVIVNCLWFPVHLLGHFRRNLRREIHPSPHLSQLLYHPNLTVMLSATCLYGDLLMDWFGFHIQALFSFPLILHPPACMCAKSRQSGPTLCDPKDCSLPGSSVHGILSFPFPYEMGFQLSSNSVMSNSLGSNCTYLTEFLWGLNGLIEVKCFTIAWNTASSM